MTARPDQTTSEKRNFNFYFVRDAKSEALTSGAKFVCSFRVRLATAGTCDTVWTLLRNPWPAGGGVVPEADVDSRGRGCLSSWRLLDRVPAGQAQPEIIRPKVLFVRSGGSQAAMRLRPAAGFCQRAFIELKSGTRKRQE